jgi:hypothetical protein
MPTLKNEVFSLNILKRWHLTFGWLNNRKKPYCFAKLARYTPMDSNTELLNNLSKSAGVDLAGIKEKYVALKSAVPAKVPTTRNQQSNGTVDFQKLENYKICKSCNGKGTVKSIYNHMVLERECEECEGESIIMTSEKLAEIAGSLES